MKYSDIKLSITTQWNRPNGVEVVPYIEGAPGGGKSALAKEIGKELGFDHVELFFASLRDPVDLLGTPHADGEVTRWRPPEELMRLSTGRNLLILDELSDAVTPMQNALCGLIYDGKAGPLQLSRETHIIATGNRTKDKSGANRIVSKLRGRVRTFEYTENIDDWSAWALENDIDPVLIQFLRFRPNLLSDFDPDKICPTPRNWERVNHIDPNLPTDVYFANVAGDVGEGAAAEYTGFRRIYEGLPNIDALLMNPAKAEVPTDPAVLYALTGALAHRVSKDNFDRVSEYVSRLKPEFQVMCVSDAMKLAPEIKTTKAFVQWAVSNSNVMI
jgi:hypothetical protein